jgi:hypothetical protein
MFVNAIYYVHAHLLKLLHMYTDGIMAATDKGNILANDKRIVIRTIHTSYFENLQTFSCAIF